MRGAEAFTGDEATKICELLAERSRAELPEAKRLRQELGDMDFYISDWEYGLDPAGFRALVDSGAIRVARRERGSRIVGGSVGLIATLI